MNLIGDAIAGRFTNEYSSDVAHNPIATRIRSTFASTPLIQAATSKVSAQKETVRDFLIDLLGDNFSRTPLLI